MSTKTVADMKPEELESLITRIAKREVAKALPKNKVQKWPDIMSTKQATEYLRSKGHEGFDEGSRRMYSLTNAKQISKVKLGGRNGFRREDLDKWSNGDNPVE